MNKLSTIVISLFACIPIVCFAFDEYNSSESTADSTIQLSSKPNNMGLGVDIYGQDSTTPLIRNVMLDTGSANVIIPKTCLDDSSAYEVMITDTQDPWGNPAQVMGGPISLRTTSGELVTVWHLGFYTLTVDHDGKTVPCDASSNVPKVGGFPEAEVIYGINENLFVHIAQTTDNKYYEITPQPNPKLVFYKELPQDFKPIPINSTGGPGGLPVVISNFTVSIGADKTTEVSGLNGVIDTGGGITVIQNDGFLSSIKAKSVAVACGITWLEECKCIKDQSDVKIAVDSTDVKYCFKAKANDWANMNSNIVAVCPSTAQKINPNPGINPGINLFDNNRVMFDVINKKVGFIPISTPTCE